MSKLKKIEPVVRKVLEENEQARSDDFLLVAEVYYKLVPECVHLPFSVVMLGHKSLNLPYFESIRRSRQKLQAAYEELRPPQEVQDARLNKTAEYINYSIDEQIIEGQLSIYDVLGVR